MEITTQAGNGKFSVDINVNLNLNLTPETVAMVMKLLGGSLAKINTSNVSNNNEAKEADSQPAETEVAKVVETVNEVADVLKDAARGPQETSSSMPFDADAVANCIESAVNLITNDSDLQEASDMLRDEVLNMTDGLVVVTLQRFGRLRNVLPNFRLTPQIVENHVAKWPGVISLDKVAMELTVAFSGMDTKALSDARKKVSRQKGYSQGTYQRVKRGSGLIRMRCHKDSDELAPMVIDPEIGEMLYNDKYTHVILRSCCNKDKEPVKNRINLIFKKEAVPTRAPYKSTDDSRLKIYGRSGGSNNSESHVTTYAINGDSFQRSILRHFKETCTGKKECLFRIVRTGPETDKGIAYEIKKYNAAQNS